MNLRILVVLLALAGVLACAEDPTAPDGCVIGEAEARSRAASVLEVAGLDWGQPETVDFEDLLYTLSYPTPADELADLGQRIVWVDCLSGTASVPPRPLPSPRIGRS